MSDKKSLGAQMAGGITMGILLQPVSMLIVLGVVRATERDSEALGWGSMGAVLLYGFYFGMAQVLTILPASLLMLLVGKPGVVRGLLYVGTTLALWNIARLIALYALGHQII